MKATRILVIDNSIFFRDELADKLQEYLPTGSLVERASDPVTAKDKLATAQPEVVIMNFSMANHPFEGKRFLAYLGELKPVIVFSNQAEWRNVALQNGAVDFIQKPLEPANVFYRTFALRIELAATQYARRGETTKQVRPNTTIPRSRWQEVSQSIVDKPLPTASTLNTVTAAASIARSAALRQSLAPADENKGRFVSPHRDLHATPMLHAVSVSHNITGGTPRPTATPEVADAPVSVKVSAAKPIDLIAIGSSTGGTEALSTIMKKLTAPLPPIVIVQHIPALFAKLFAQRLDGECALQVKEGEDGEMVRPNTVYIAPGGKHMTVSREAGGIKISCAPGPKVHSCCPSVDVLFDSVAKNIGASALGVILTGMGKDGAEKLLAMRRQGSPTIGQDKESSVVYGMPRAAFEIGAVEQQFPLTQIADAITAIARRK
ncbi:MAG: response regulator [Selenomonadaceae bacterium]|nr:response regulator [Selenomonadaceae bacterium]